MSEIYRPDFYDYGGYDGREEYDTQAAAAPNGSGAALIELIDGLMIENTPLATTGASVAVTGQAYGCKRQFSYLEAHGDTLIAGMVSETTITIDYQADRLLSQHRYRVAISWMLASMTESKLIGPLEADYSIVSYNNGPVYGYVSTPNLLIEKRRGQPYTVEERELTTYDYIDLANELSVIYDLTSAPWPDNREAAFE